MLPLRQDAMNLPHDLVCCPGNNMIRVALKTARRQGATRARCRCASQLRSNAGAGLFSAQPSGPQSFGCRPALLARPVSEPIQALRSRLARRPNPKRRASCYFRDSTLGMFDEGSDQQPEDPLLVCRLAFFCSAVASSAPALIAKSFYLVGKLPGPCFHLRSSDNI
jgi:hypothetical protein